MGNEKFEIHVALCGDNVLRRRVAGFLQHEPIYVSAECTCVTELIPLGSSKDRQIDVDVVIVEESAIAAADFEGLKAEFAHMRKFKWLLVGARKTPPQCLLKLLGSKGMAWISSTARATDFTAALTALVSGSLLVMPPNSQLFSGHQPAEAAFNGSDRNVPALSLLSPAEQRVMRCAASGLHDKEIAATLGIAKDTVHAHLQHIFRKLDVRKRRAAVQKCFPPT